MVGITLDKLSITFPIFDYSSLSVRQTALRLGARKGAASAGTSLVHALRDLSLTFTKGDTVGLIGHNGSGKSTLLRVLAGVYEPTTGTVTSSGKVCSLFNVSAGMDLEATGHENIMLLGVCAGLSRREVHAFRDEIIDFADIGDAIGRPVRTYSAGMKLRLAFAVATARSAEILLIDEVIGAGDSNFQTKAKARINALMGAAHILVMASHARDVLAANCNRGLVFDHGELKFDGPINEALAFARED